MTSRFFPPPRNSQKNASTEAAIFQAAVSHLAHALLLAGQRAVSSPVGTLRLRGGGGEVCTTSASWPEARRGGRRLQCPGV